MSRRWSLALGLSLPTIVMLGPSLLSQDPIATDVASALLPPSATHWFGTDQLGRDVFARVVAAGRLDLGMALAAVALSLTLGAAIGAASGYRGGWPDMTASRLTDLLTAFPLFVLAMAIAATLGGGAATVVLATAAVNLPFYLRLARVEAAVLRDAGFVEAARMGGSGPWRILRVMLLPNMAGKLAVQAALNLGWALLNAAGLSFLGLGPAAPTPEWGAMVADGAAFAASGRWWIAFFPGLALVIAALCFAWAGDALRDALDPRARR